MYHEITYAQEKRRRAKRLAIVLVMVAFVAAFLLAMHIAQASAREQAVVSVRESVLNAAKQCCAVEGSYPASLSHLEKEYGLVIMKVIVENGEELLSTPDSDEEEELIYNLFMERIFEESEED